MALRFRPANPSEVAECVKQWVSSFEPSGRVSIGSTSRSITAKLWRRAHTLLIGELLAPKTPDGPGGGAEIVVAVIDEISHEPLAWVCHDETHVHYVYTVPRGRGKGLRLASRLLKYVGAKPNTHTNAGGEALLGSVARKERAA